MKNETKHSTCPINHHRTHTHIRKSGLWRNRVDSLVSFVSCLIRMRLTYFLCVLKSWRSKRIKSPVLHNIKNHFSKTSSSMTQAYTNTHNGRGTEYNVQNVLSLSKAIISRSFLLKQLLLHSLFTCLFVNGESFSFYGFALSSSSVDSENPEIKSRQESIESFFAFLSLMTINGEQAKLIVTIYIRSSVRRCRRMTTVLTRHST